MRKILMLGGSHFQIPAIKYARDVGYYVITADYLPDNPGHQFSHEYHNVSTVDKEAVLRLAKKLSIDGIISYASDPGAPTAAYVAQNLDLPGNPYESVLILQRKDLFRKFLKENGYLVPVSDSFSNIEEARGFASDRLKSSPVVIKPVDSSGSKGVSVIKDLGQFDMAYESAEKYSVSNFVLVEDFIEKAIYEMDGDGFVWQGKLVFACFGNQHNDLACNPYVPTGISFPYIQKTHIQEKAYDIVDSILGKLNMQVGGLNIEYLTDKDENIYILEIGPRSGGNLIPEVIRYTTGVDLIAYSIDGAMGNDCSDLKMKETNGYYSSYILHSQNDGVVQDVHIDPSISDKIVQQQILVKPGDHVEKFNGSNSTLGTFVLKFENSKEMTSCLDRMNDYIRINLLPSAI
jgi:biotin carboxylase